MKLKTIGQAFIIVLAVSMAAVQEVARFKKDALILKDTETKEPIFRISADKSRDNSLTAVGANFPVTNSEGFPQLTLMLPANVCPEQRVQYVKDNYGFALDHIGNLEVQIQQAYEEVTTKLGAVVAEMEVD